MNIDPPYNTGNDFVYKDDYKDNLSNYLAITGQIDEEGNKTSTNSEAGGRYHTNWLNMMYPRLRLARNLLTDDGLIFISIDDNEVSTLKKICDEIFGEENYRNSIIIKRGAKSVQGQFDTWDKLSSGFEYVLMYSKSSNYRFKKMFMELDSLKQGSWNNHWRGTDRPTMRYELFGINPDSGQWRWSKERSYKAIENYNEMLFELGKNNENVTQEEIDKWYASKVTDEDEKIDLLRLSKNNKPEHYIPASSTQLLNDVWFDFAPNSSSVLKNLFDKKVFDTPKPLMLIKRILEFGNKDDIILDFFSGSATTAHVVMQQNSEDFGERRFIMVQLPQETGEKSDAFKAGYKNICEIGKERIRRAGDKIIEENKDKVGIDDLDIGFKVFKLDSSNIKPWNPRYDNVEMSLEDVIDNFLPGRTEEDVVYEIMLKYGIDLTYPIEVREVSGKKVFSIGFGALIICLDDEITLEVVNGIVDFKNELTPETTRVVFKDNGFKTDSVKTNTIEILKRNNITEIMSI